MGSVHAGPESAYLIPDGLDLIRKLQRAWLGAQALHKHVLEHRLCHDGDQLDNDESAGDNPPGLASSLGTGLH